MYPKMAKVLAFIISVIASCSCTSVKNVHDQMYLQLDATTPCVLRLNGSQSFGCTSSRNGNVGVVHVVYNSTDLDWVLNSPPMDSYIVALNLDMFSFKNLEKLNNSDHVNGVLLMQNGSRQSISNFSPEDTCPNRYSGLAAPPNSRNVCEQPWNPPTIYSTISMHKWNMPIFFTDDAETIQQVETYFLKFNLPLDETQLTRSLCALKMSAHMFASTDSTTCIRKSNAMYNVNPVRFCEPLGDNNVWVPLVPFSRSPQPKQKFIVVSARLDSTSLFFGLASGTLSTATSLVTFISTAQLLFNLTSGQHIQENVLFVLFNGEAYDYIGSSRVVYDMEHGQFPFSEHPIGLDDISLFIELSQLQNTKSVTYHSFKSPDSEMSKFIKTFQEKTAKYGFTVSGSSSTSQFPPASFQSFLAKNENMSGFVFSSYENQFTNKFYHSLYDDAVNVGYKYTNGSDISEDSLQSFVANFATALAHSLYAEITGKDGATGVDRRQVDEMLHCYIDSVNCKFAKQVDYPVDPTRYQKLDYYVGVNMILGRQEVASLTAYALVHLTGRHVMLPEISCYLGKNSTHHVYYYWSDAASQCLETAMNTSDALSPAFIIEDYNLADGVYSSWTESSWRNIDVRMFLQPSPRYEWFVFAVGNAVIVLSFVLVYWIKNNSRELFNAPHLMSASNI